MDAIAKHSRNVDSMLEDISKIKSTIDKIGSIQNIYSNWWLFVLGSDAFNVGELTLLIESMIDFRPSQKFVIEIIRNTQFFFNILKLLFVKMLLIEIDFFYIQVIMIYLTSILLPDKMHVKLGYMNDFLKNYYKRTLC